MLKIRSNAEITLVSYANTLLNTASTDSYLKQSRSTLGSPDGLLSLWML